MPFVARCGGPLCACIGWRRAGIRCWFFADALAPAVLVARSIGRIGTYLNLNRPRFDAVSFRVWKENVHHAQEDSGGDQAARSATRA